jgi:ribosomal protein S18 acetylase RimI-like enzyme
MSSEALAKEDGAFHTRAPDGRPSAVISQLSIRRATEADAAVLAGLERETFAQAYRDMHSAADIAAYCAEHYTLEAAQRQLSDSDYICALAYRANEATGFYTFSRLDAPAAVATPTIELKKIYVLAQEFGSGLGQTLLDHALQTARELGVRSVWLCVSASNPRARAFYQKRGFSEAGAGPVLVVGSERLESLILILPV